jgi:hypothetical protein
MYLAAAGCILTPHMPYIPRVDPQRSFHKLLFSILQWAVAIGVTLGFALFLWRSGR